MFLFCLVFFHVCVMAFGYKEFMYLYLVYLLPPEVSTRFILYFSACISFPDSEVRPETEPGGWEGWDQAS